MGLPLVSEHQENACAGGIDCDGRLSVSPHTFTGGMETQPSGGLTDLVPFLESDVGSVCFSRISPLPAVVFIDREVQPSGSGCSSPYLARCATLCISSNPPNSANSPQDSSWISHSTFGGAELAGETMVTRCYADSSRGNLDACPGDRISFFSCKGRFGMRIQIDFSCVSGRCRARITVQGLQCQGTSYNPKFKSTFYQECLRGCWIF